ncbi:YqaE/Pmp3 family membrane protein [Emcibacter nanhaiensis]|uniref:YqaE/Pmp3 family membrane protein n=1 Tax=Emcibacter nanhaiensis TaxID=1505037 RepID=A0A501PI41_9PROT|nr:YqaE/Pmp3 family membrane protein [Emcibacter nanhaiensis]TPD59738.1 YqaE/Pmp3 family membrane protein [Emcibacter nanhaiensis]
MIYLLAFFLPPVALFVYGKIFQAIINLVIWIVGFVFLLLGGWILWGIAVGHAIFVIHSAKADARTKKIVEAMNMDK